MTKTKFLTFLSKSIDFIEFLSSTLDTKYLFSDAFMHNKFEQLMASIQNPLKVILFDTAGILSVTNRGMTEMIRCVSDILT